MDELMSAHIASGACAAERQTRCLGTTYGGSRLALEREFSSFRNAVFGSFWNAVQMWVSGEWFLGVVSGVSGKRFLGSGFWGVATGERILGSGFWGVGPKPNQKKP